MNESIGSRIKNRRLELGLSVDDLANKLGKNRATVYRYESNEIENMPLDVIEPLAKALDTTPSYLMGWYPDETVQILKNTAMEMVTQQEGNLSETKKALVNVVKELSDSEAAILLASLNSALGKQK